MLFLIRVRQSNGKIHESASLSRYPAFYASGERTADRTKPAVDPAIIQFGLEFMHRNTCRPPQGIGNKIDLGSKSITILDLF
jgi:hypothetical protein